MASVLEAEVLLAQRLASNEKYIRSRAIKKLRKYISVRSLKGGFTEEDLLKLWKGLFYCLWMQDKPLLQEDLSNQICSLIHNFHDFDKQLMYLQCFLQTMKREWMGIDRLRMDKFYQLVRFMIRQTFELLKRNNWENNVVDKFRKLLTSELLQGDSKAPSGLQLHILDLYLTELAAVGAVELTADQNLMFIEPFCKTAAKTKSRMLFSAICKNIFSTIINQAPFAVEDLIKEMKALDSDSGQESEEDKCEENKTRSKNSCKKPAGKQINGRKQIEDDDDDDDNVCHLDDSDSELPQDDVGPILQFDFSAVADKLLELASQSSTPGHNRKKLYKIISVLRNLSEGIFPQDEEEEVSTDEDDDMFGSRKRIKRRARRDIDEEEAPTGKKKKREDEPGKKKEELNKQNKNTDSADGPVNNEKKKKKKKKKNAKNKEQSSEQAESTNKETCSENLPEPVLLQNSSSETSEYPAGNQFLEATKNPKVTEGGQPESQSSGGKIQSKKKKRKRNMHDSTACVTEMEEKKHISASAETSSEAEVSLQVNKKDLKTKDDTQILRVTKTSPEVCDKSPKRKSQKGEVDPGSVNGVSLSTEVTSVNCAEDLPNPKFEKTVHNALSTKKMLQRKGPKAEKDGANASVQLTKIKKKKSKQEVKLPPEVERGQMHEESPAADDSAATPLEKKKNHKRSASAGEEKTPISQVDVQTGPPTKRKKKKMAKQMACHLNENQDARQLQVDGADAEPPSQHRDCVMTTGKAVKKKIPIEFEYEADEVEEMTPVSWVTEANTKRGSDLSQPSTPSSLRNSLKKKKKKSITESQSNFINFQTESPVPTPLFCKTKRRPSTPISTKKKIRTPMSESKKVTFGLKNNKTAEFKKTDRSLLLSPDGSSRVPFDPQQKPKFGVLKSSPTPHNKTFSSTPTKKVKKRPKAADFF